MRSHDCVSCREKSDRMIVSAVEQRAIACGREVANTEEIAYLTPSYPCLRLNCCAKTTIALPLSQALIPPPTNPLKRT